MKYAKIIDGIVDTIAMDPPGHFEQEAYDETIIQDGVEITEQRERRIFVADASYIKAGDEVFAGFAYDGKTFTAPPASPLTSNDVNAERTRREQAGCVVTVLGAGPIALEGNDKAMRNLQGLAFAASLRAGQGDTKTITVFRDANNTDHTLVPMQIISLWSKGAAYISAVYQASWAIKELTPIPADFADHTRWPSYE